MQIIQSAIGWFLGLGSSLIVMFVLLILGLSFRVGFAKALRGGVTTGHGGDTPQEGRGRATKPASDTRQLTRGWFVDRHGSGPTVHRDRA